MGPGAETKHDECGYCKHLALLVGVPISWADFIGLVDYFHTQSVQTSDYSFGVRVTGMIDCAEQLNEMFRLFVAALCSQMGAPIKRALTPALHNRLLVF